VARRAEPRTRPADRRREGRDHREGKSKPERGLIRHEGRAEVCRRGEAGWGGGGEEAEAVAVAGTGQVLLGVAAGWVGGALPGLFYPGTRAGRVR
jgi:hypothetical protein